MQLTKCRGCEKDVSRDADSCAACGWPVVIDCPVCSEQMRAVTHDGLRLDTCRSCHGIWFDTDELRTLLEGKVTKDRLIDKGLRRDEAAAIARRRGDPSTAEGVIGVLLSLLEP